MSGGRAFQADRSLGAKVKRHGLRVFKEQQVKHL